MLCDQCLSTDHCKKFGPVCRVKNVTLSALDKQESGNHYKDKGIQPIVYIYANDLGFCEANVLKYITRHKQKNGAADVRKAIHYLELLLELEYKE